MIEEDQEKATWTHPSVWAVYPFHIEKRNSEKFVSSILEHKTCSEEKISLCMEALLRYLERKRVHLH